MRAISLFSLLFVAQAAAQPVAFRVSTAAGSFPLGNDGPARQALLGRPSYVTYDRAGNLYIADTGNHMIRRVDSTGRITAVAGSGLPGNTGDGGSALLATLNAPSGLVVDGNLLYVADEGNYRVRVIQLETGVMEGYAGLGTPGFAGDNGPAGNARFRSLSALAVDNQGNLLICDPLDNRVRRVNKSTGVITTFAGNGNFGFGGENVGATTVGVAGPAGLAVDTDGSVYIAAADIGQVFKVAPAGSLTRFAGKLLSNNFADGILATDAGLIGPTGLALDRSRRVLIVSDWDLGTIREISLGTNLITTIAGDAIAPFGFSGDGGSAKNAIFGGPWGIAVEAATGFIAISDIPNFRIRRIAAGTIDTVAGRPPFAGDGGPALQAILFRPATAISDGAGGMYIADNGNCVVRRVTRAGNISTVAGVANRCVAATTEGQPASITTFSGVNALARDRAGNLYVAERARVRVISPEGAVNTLASSLRTPTSLALDPTHNFLYVVESAGHRITKIEIATKGVSVLAGSTGGTSGYVDGPGSQARFFAPFEAAVDAQGNIFVADSFNGRIRRIDASTSNVTSVAGDGTPVPANEGMAARASVGLPTGLALDSAGNIYYSVAQRVYRIVRGQIQLIAGSVGGFGGDGGFGPQARFNIPISLHLDEGGNVLVADQGNHRVRVLTPTRAASVAVLSGNAQSGPVRGELRDPLVVQVKLADGSAVPGIPVAFTTSAGALSAARVLTGADGTALVRLTLPETAGAVTVTATVEELPAVRFMATANTVIVPSPTRPSIRSAITAGAFGAAARIAPGTWMELYGSNFAASTLQWSGSDFVNGQAPTTLGGVRVTVAGQPAFVQLVSPGQINAQVPDGIGTGRVAIQVTNADGTSESFMAEAAERAPALLSPPAFLVSGRQYVAALHTDGAFVGPANLIAGAAFRPAKAGDRILVYGVGFGVTTPAIAAGTVVTSANALPALAVQMAGRAVTVEYGGLAGNFVGLYQFNLVVPEGVSGDVALSVTVNGVALSQSLTVTVE